MRRPYGQTRQGAPSQKCRNPLRRPSALPNSQKTMAVRSPAVEILPGVFGLNGSRSRLLYSVRRPRRPGRHRLRPHIPRAPSKTSETSASTLGVIDAVLVCHIHVDHAAALADARRILRAPVVTHVNNVPGLRGGRSGCHRRVGPLHRLGFPLPGLRCRHPRRKMAIK